MPQGVHSAPTGPQYPKRSSVPQGVLSTPRGPQREIGVWGSSQNPMGFKGERPSTSPLAFLWFPLLFLLFLDLLPVIMVPVCVCLVALFRLCMRYQVST